MATRIEQDDPPFDVEARRLRLCRELLVERQIIARYLKKQDWSHAGWIMLLELYVADTVDQRLPVSSLGYASGVSIPTATRQTIEMKSCKFVFGEPHHPDGRSTDSALPARGRAILRCIHDDHARSRHRPSTHTHS